jgi:hypothetical protein
MYAEKPLIENPENIATIMIEKLGYDVQLSDSQKMIIKLKAKEFVVKMKTGNSVSNEKDKFSYKKQASNQYHAALDSILTDNQKEQIKLKIAEREVATQKKYDSNGTSNN